MSGLFIIFWCGNYNITSLVKGEGVQLSITSRLMWRYESANFGLLVFIKRVVVPSYICIRFIRVELVNFYQKPLIGFAALKTLLWQIH